MSLPRYYVPHEKIREGVATVGGDDLQHMRRVLRLRPGAPVLLFDGDGAEYQGVIREYGEGVARVAVSESLRPRRESPLDITLAQAVGKGEKMDWIVEKVTELGVDKIVSFFSSHTVPRLDAGKIGKRLARWEKIALAAAKQSGRLRLPRVVAASHLDEVLAQEWPCDERLFFWENASETSLFRLRQARDSCNAVLIVVGPEGGFTEEEAVRASNRGFTLVRFGPRRLRMETAAVGAVSAVQLLWGDLG